MDVFFYMTCLSAMHDYLIGQRLTGHPADCFVFKFIKNSVRTEKIEDVKRS